MSAEMDGFGPARARRRGRLVVIEGPDLFGKSTQVARSVDELSARGERVASMRFPSETSTVAPDIARYLRDGIASSGRRGAPREHDPYEIAALFIADRHESGARIEALLADGVTVVLSRYWPSTAAFQGAYLNDDEREVFLQWRAFAEQQLPEPDLIVLLSGDVTLVVDAAETRETPAHLVGSAKTRDIHEADLALQRRVAEIYDELAERHGWERVAATDAQGRRSIDDVARDVLEAIDANARVHCA